MGNKKNQSQSQLCRAVARPIIGGRAYSHIVSEGALEGRAGGDLHGQLP